jgi:DNA-binding response OmpR family regulator
MKEHKTILLAEMDEFIGNEIRRYFESKNYFIYPTVEKGEDLLIQAKILSPSLIITDTNLKGHLDGIEAISRLRQDCKIPYIFITSFDDDVRLIKSYFLEPICLIQKPISLINLNFSFDRANSRLELV